MAHDSTEIYGLGGKTCPLCGYISVSATCFVCPPDGARLKNTLPFVSRRCNDCAHEWYISSPEEQEPCPSCESKRLQRQPIAGRSDLVSLDYPEAARSIALNLQEFCDESLDYPTMIADAARKAASQIDGLREELRRVQEYEQSLDS